MKPATCHTCGAPSEQRTCRYCGTSAGDTDGLIARTHFDASDGGWSIPSQPLHGAVLIEHADRPSVLRVDVGGEDELGDVIVPVAWVAGTFVDVIAAMDVRFESPPCDAAAGFWLRLERDRGLSVMCWDSGRITIGTRREAHLHSLATVPAPPGYVEGRTVRLMVSVIGQVISVMRDGAPVSSTTIDWPVGGAVQARVQVGAAQARVVLLDPVARVPVVQGAAS